MQSKRIDIGARFGRLTCKEIVCEWALAETLGSAGVIAETKWKSAKPCC